MQPQLLRQLACMGVAPHLLLLARAWGLPLCAPVTHGGVGRGRWQASASHWPDEMIVAVPPAGALPESQECSFLMPHSCLAGMGPGAAM